MNLWQQVEAAITKHSGASFSISRKQSIGGGSINRAYRVTDGLRTYFVKTNRKELAFMFVAEEKGLEALYASNSIKVPEPISYGVSGQECYFIMEWLNLHGQPKGDLFGSKMAELHRVTHEKFGFIMDNSIGSTPQLNSWSDNWIEFWQQHRLGYQLQLAKQNGLKSRFIEKGWLLSESTPLFFNTYHPVASLLHGDLWSGNWGADEAGVPVIFDPATYYGDREADLAMMELFGHPGRAFYNAYQEAFPLDEGFSIRKTFYNLYHILNHANMFGGGYASQAETMIDRLLAEVKS